jgi:hypothetical protein
MDRFGFFPKKKHGLENIAVNHQFRKKITLIPDRIGPNNKIDDFLGQIPKLLTVEYL